MPSGHERQFEQESRTAAEGGPGFFMPTCPESTVRADETTGPTVHPERAGLRFTIVADWCLRTQGNACEACAEACPHGAIALPAEDAGLPLVDPALCTDCGVCQGVCDAFSSTERTVQDAAARALRAADRGDAVYAACEACVPAGTRPAANAVVFPCLAAGCAEFWTLALTADTPLVAVCDFDRCAECEIAGPDAMDRCTKAIEQAQEWTGRSVGLASELPLERTIVQDYARNDEFDRRGILRKLALDATEAANGTRRVKTASVLQDFRARQDRLRATARLTVPDDDKFKGFKPEGHERRLVPPRERMLEQAIARMPEIAERSARGKRP